jgi:poly-gamma-glutamate synthesis protein (capsule biosynthesis protein)
MMLSLGFVGDFLYPFEEYYNEEKDNKELFRKVDLCIGNLESPIIFKNKEYRESRKLVKLFSLNGIEGFVRNHNIKAVSLANNHIFDFGIEGFKDTIYYLDEKLLVKIILQLYSKI